MTPIGNGHNDDGLQPERTLLAWGRTLLSMLVASLFLLRWLPIHGVLAAGMIGATLVVAVLIWVSQQHRYRHRVAGMTSARLAPDATAVLGLGAMVTLLGAGALWIVL